MLCLERGQCSEVSNRVPPRFAGLGQWRLISWPNDDKDGMKMLFEGSYTIGKGKDACHRRGSFSELVGSYEDYVEEVQEVYRMTHGAHNHKTVP